LRFNPQASIGKSFLTSSRKLQACSVRLTICVGMRLALLIRSVTNNGRPASAGDPEDGFQGKDMGFAFGIVVILSILFLPIPAFLIDVGLAFSIAFSVLILMVALWIRARSISLPFRPFC
jgi:hypothetical protein